MVFRRGTIAIESMILWGFISVFIIVLSYSALTYFNYQYRSSQTDSSLRSIAITANAVYNLRPGSEETIAVEIPAGILSSEISQKKIQYTLTGFTTAEENFTLETIPALIGELPTEQGRHYISVKVLNESLVRIGSGVYIFTITPSTIDSRGKPATVVLFGDEFQTGLNVLVDGAVYPGGLVRYIDYNYVEFDVPPGQIKARPEPYKISVQNPTGEISNEVDLYVI